MPKEGQQGRRPRGRPASPPGEGKLYAVGGFRTTKEIKDFLEQSADFTGRSMAGELEARVLQSRDFEAALGGPRAAAFFRSLAGTIEHFFHDDRWVDEYDKYVMVRSLFLRLLDDMAPPKPEPIEALIQHVRNGLRTILAFNDEEEDYLGPDMREPIMQLARKLAENPKIPADVQAEFIRSLAEIEASG
jgi:hypothetical protein